RRMMPWKPCKYTTTRGSYGKPTELRPSLRPLKRPEISKSEAKSNGPRIGDASKPSCLRCAGRVKVEAQAGRERQQLPAESEQESVLGRQAAIDWQGVSRRTIAKSRSKTD